MPTIKYLTLSFLGRLTFAAIILALVVVTPLWPAHAAFDLPNFPTRIHGTEGVTITNAVVGNFLGPPAGPLSTYTATINWGDGTAFTVGTVTAIYFGVTVSGSHTYAEEGSYNISVTIQHFVPVGVLDATGSCNTPATILDAPLTVGSSSAGAATQFSGVGGDNTSATVGSANAALTAFQSAIGGVNNGANPPGQANGFRAINWDGVALDGTDFGSNSLVIVPNKIVGIPVNRFQERGIAFDQVYAVSGDGFVSANATDAGQFPAFSPSKTFAPFSNTSGEGAHSLDFSFVLPSSHLSQPVGAVTRGFGAIFVDVEGANSTSIEYFNGTTSLGKFFVPAGTSGQAEFFGVLFQNPVVTRVHIELGTSYIFSFDGTTLLAGGPDGAIYEHAVTDDFAYAEPVPVSTGINVNAFVGEPVTAKVASFSDADPNGQVGDFSSIIDWGDSSTSAGSIASNGGGLFDVTGTHTYAAAGPFTISTTIRDVGGSSIGTRSAATVVPLPTLAINNVTVTEGNSGTTSATFPVTLSAANSQTVTVDYVTSDITAGAPGDYTPQTGTLTFAPGVTTRNIVVPVVGDTLPEPTETFLVTLFNPNNATVTTAQGTGTINDDDATGAFQFSASTASVAENANPGSVNLTINRTGDTSGAASVRFETSDITAKQKTDYTFNSGIVQFGPNDTSKTINVLIVNDAFSEGPETFAVTLSNPSGNFVVGNPNSVVVTITDDDAVLGANPIDNAGFFVRQQYLDFLGREPDASGLTFWTNNITGCGADLACMGSKRVDTSAAFFFSIEFQETSGSVLRTQRVAFGRQSNDPLTRVPYLQFMRDTRQVGQGLVVGQAGFDTLLEQNKQAYAAQVVLDPTFTIRFPPAPGPVYVDALFASAGVAPTVAERTAAINAFGAGGTTGRIAALRTVADSNSVRQADFSPSFVLAQFYGYLRRNPTDAPDFNDAGYQFWLTKLNALNGDFRGADMVKSFILSNEYRLRFGP